MGLTALLNVGDRAGRLQAPPPRPEAGAAHLGHRHELHPAERRPAVEGPVQPGLPGRHPEHQHPDRACSGWTPRIEFTFKQFFVVVITIPLLFVLTWFVNRTRQGKAMRATAQDPDTAGLMGINVDRTIAITFVIAGALAGAAGLVQILYNNTTVWNLGFRFGLNSFTSAVLGGIGNLQGAVLGGLILGLINAFSDRYLSAAWTNAHRLRRPDRDPRLPSHRPARPEAAGPRMSQQLITPVRPESHRRPARLVRPAGRHGHQLARLLPGRARPQPAADHPADRARRRDLPVPGHQRHVCTSRSAGRSRCRCRATRSSCSC